MSTELIIPEITESELSKVTENLLNKDQLNFLFKKTPQSHIYERPAKGGGNWQYVTGSYFKKVLNLMFGWNWDFEIIDEIVNLEVGQVIIKGKLTVRTGGQAIIKMQYGRQDLKFKNDFLLDDKGNKVMGTNGSPKKFKTTIPLDLGNDLKGAATDSLKKCASELGIASDVYAPKEYKEISIIEDHVDKDWDKITYVYDLLRTSTYDDDTKQQLEIKIDDANMLELDEIIINLKDCQAPPMNISATEAQQLTSEAIEDPKK